MGCVFGDDDMHGFVPGCGREVVHELKGVAQADGRGSGRHGQGEEPVVIPAAKAQACAGRVKGHAGYEDEVRGKGLGRLAALCRRLGDAETARDGILQAGQAAKIDQAGCVFPATGGKQTPAFPDGARDEFPGVHFAAHGQVGQDFPGRAPLGQGQDPGGHGGAGRGHGLGRQGLAPGEYGRA